jgi:hypothetical protein
MKHFDITQWADSVRGIGPGLEQKQMQSHLDTGCSRCNQLASLFDRVAKMARADSEATPPDYAVRSVRAYFVLNQPTRRSWLQEVGLALTFDNQLEPASVNTRTDSPSTRQLTYGSQEYVLDLTVDQPEVGGEAGVAGYCLRQEGEPVAGAPVFLISRGQFAGQGMTGELGEFQFDAEIVDPMELWVFDNNDLPVAVSLNLEQAA